MIFNLNGFTQPLIGGLSLFVFIGIVWTIFWTRKYVGYYKEMITDDTIIINAQNIIIMQQSKIIQNQNKIMEKLGIPDEHSPQDK